VDLSALTPAHRRLLAAAAVALLLLFVAVPRVLHRGASRADVPPLRAPAAPARVADSRLVVYVSGAVRRPGLYRLARGTRIDDAVTLAGGATARADLLAVNLAAPLADGEQIVVPPRGAAGASGGAGSSSTAPLDLNSASLEQLDELPGIGPTTAQKILDYRQQHGAFRSLADLDAVPGIGPSRLEQLKGLVVPS
jgi:competence protein ComEA